MTTSQYLGILLAAVLSGLMGGGGIIYLFRTALIRALQDEFPSLKEFNKLNDYAKKLATREEVNRLGGERVKRVEEEVHQAIAISNAAQASIHQAVLGVSERVISETSAIREMQLIHGMALRRTMIRNGEPEAELPPLPLRK